MTFAAPTPSLENAIPRIAVVIPCYRVKRHILGVLERIGPECDAIYVVDDACPENSGRHVSENCTDPRVTVLWHESNKGVGGATLTGLARAVADGAAVAVKIDGDGQMDPALIRRFVRPILQGEADYTKGNRFYDLDDVRGMPPARLIGNAILSFVTKLSSGYWDLFDPTNGYTAIHANLIRHMPLEKIARRYFFESDMLFRLYTVRAVVMDIPMKAVYGDETSSLKIKQIVGGFLLSHIRNTAKRVLYSYFLRDFSMASIYLLFGLALTGFGIAFGASQWIEAATRGITASVGTVMLASLPIILGFQMLVAFMAYDTGNIPRNPIHKRLDGRS